MLNIMNSGVKLVIKLDGEKKTQQHKSNGWMPEKVGYQDSLSS